MRFAVLGAGLQGVACAYDLLCNPRTEVVKVFDAARPAVEAAAARIASERFLVQQLDCSNANLLTEAVRGLDVVVSALPYRMNLAAARAVLEAGASFLDMGGNTELVLEELKLGELAKEKGACLVPDCGLAPGLTNVLAADAVASLDEVDQIRIRVGGIPARPVPPWNYRLVFSFEGLINEYTGQAAVLRDWSRAEVPVLEGIEELDFPAPIGRCEAAFTSGGSSTLPWSFAGRVRELDYKTVRYPGHFEKLKALRALGLFSREPIAVDGQLVVPLSLLKQLFLRTLGPSGEPDLVVLRVTSQGKKDGSCVRLIHQLVDRRDEGTGFSAMMRTTAFPTSIIAQLIASREMAMSGAFPPERVVPPARLMEELERRGIRIERTWHVER